MNIKEMTIEDLIKTLKRQKGKWIEDFHYTPMGVEYSTYMCSVCNEKVLTNKHNFCPHCGAYMREEEGYYTNP